MMNKENKITKEIICKNKYIRKFITALVSIRNDKCKRILSISMAFVLAAFFVIYDAAITGKAYAKGLDVQEMPHAIMLGDEELAIVGSYNEAQETIDIIKKHYGADKGTQETVVTPALEIKEKELILAEEKKEPVSADEAAESIIEANSKNTPLFNVVVGVNGMCDVAVPYETEVVEDDDLEAGKTKVARDGENGTKLIFGNTMFVNGSYKTSTLLGSKIIKEPVSKIIYKGTKKETSSSSNTGGGSTSTKGSGKATGSLSWPLPSSHYVVSEFEYRNGPIKGYELHLGLDIVGSYGAPVKAADGGRVVTAGWHNSYGYQVVIDHGNGLKTRYAHNSSLAVSVGDRVSKGQTISYVGSTGDSIANHLHFEVLKNGVNVNPRNYL